MADRPFIRYNLGKSAGDPANLVASSAKLQAELGWRPQHPELGRIVESAWRTRAGMGIELNLLRRTHVP